MKKLLFAFPIVALLAAGCNSSQPTPSQTPAQTPVTQNTNPAATPTPTQTPTITPPSGMKFYTNSVYGFQVTIPQNYTVNDTGKDIIGYYNIGFYSSTDTSLNSKSEVFSIHISNSTHGSLDEYSKDPIYELPQAKNTNTQVSGQPAMKVVVTATSIIHVNQVQYWIIHNGEFFQLQQEEYGTVNQLDTFVSSFKFTE